MILKCMRHPTQTSTPRPTLWKKTGHGQWPHALHGAQRGGRLPRQLARGCGRAEAPGALLLHTTACVRYGRGAHGRTHTHARSVALMCAGGGAVSMAAYPYHPQTLAHRPKPCPVAPNHNCRWTGPNGTSSCRSGTQHPATSRLGKTASGRRSHLIWTLACVCGECSRPNCSSPNRSRRASLHTAAHKPVSCTHIQRASLCFLYILSFAGGVLPCSPCVHAQLCRVCCNFHAFSATICLNLQ